MTRKRETQQRGLALPLWVALVGAAVVVLATSGYEISTHMENHDSFCASCHSEPETTYYDRSLAGDPTDLASFHATTDPATRCIDCHSGRGVPGRIHALTIGAGDLLAWQTGTATQPAPLTHPINDANCLKCHQDVPRTQNFNRHFHAFLSQWQAIDPDAATCVDCHAAHTTDGDPTLTYLNQARTTQVCQDCHSSARQRG
jgi:predicted CXXCH cytochrome family protein